MLHHQTVIKNTAYQILSKVITSILGLATRKLLTTYLGPAGFGDYVFLLTYATLFGSIADWGTITIGVREASQNRDHKPQIFGVAIVGRFLLSLLATIVAVFFFPLLHKSGFSTPLVLTACFLIIAMALKASFGIIFESLMQMQRWVIVEVGASLSTLLFYIVAVLFHLSLFHFLLFLLISSVLASLIGLILSLKITQIDFFPPRKFFYHFGRESFPMGLALIMFSVYNRIDTVILSYYRTSSEVGFYGLAYFIYENIVLVAAYVLNSVFPFLSQSASDSSPNSKFHQLYHQYYLVMLGMGLLATLGSYFLAPFFVLILSSLQFVPSIILIRVLSFSLFFSFLNHATGYSLIALGRQRQYSLITLVALVFNLSANFIFIPFFGALAAAWITVFTEGLVQISSLFLITRTIKSFPWKIRV